MNDKTKNDANLNNPNNDAYWQAKGYEKRPKNWRHLLPKNYESKRSAGRNYPYDGRGGVDNMFDPLCKDDY